MKIRTLFLTLVIILAAIPALWAGFALSDPALRSRPSKIGWGHGGKQD